MVKIILKQFKMVAILVTEKYKLCKIHRRKNDVLREECFYRKIFTNEINCLKLVQKSIQDEDRLGRLTNSECNWNGRISQFLIDRSVTIDLDFFCLMAYQPFSVI